MLLQSSGTTGLPKIVRREAAALDAVAENMVHAIGFTPQDVVLAPLPLCHSYGVEHGLLAPLWAGSCVRFTHAFDPPVVLDQLRTGGITLFPAVPFMYEILAQLGDPGTFPTLRRAYSAGGSLPAGVRQAFHQRSGVHITQLYGASEIGSVTFARAEAPGFDPSSVGTPMRGVSIKILDIQTPDADNPLPPGQEGQVAVAAPSMLSGYLGGQPAPLIAGHFLTGDLGRLDQYGALTITGRLKLLIDVGGLKVNPLEVEGVLASHPQVAECVVVPMRVTETVNRLKAVIVAREGQAAPSPEALRAFVKQRLSAYKVPRVFELRPSLPKSATGKIVRHKV
jgi:long-chain acyl-CoA synthetase